MQFRAVKGMNDILPDEVGRWQRLEATFRRVVELHGYAEVRTPIVEGTELFVRSIGEVTDVVEKEMYSFTRGDEALTIRPEGTAGAARAYVEHTVHAREPVSRWYYIGPMFRAERPQRGRLRQFHQAGCEVYGDPGPAADAEMIDMLCSLFRELGLSDLDVCVNSLGGPDSRERYRQALLEYLRPRAAELSDHARARLEKNPLRVLDSKDPRDQAACQGAPSILDVLTDEDRQHWERLLDYLGELGTPFRIDTTLVRGLDYYTRTIFEIKAGGGELGSQNTICAGGRYDGMVKTLGGPKVPAIGFAMGLERLLLLMGEGAVAPPPFCFIAPIGDQALRTGLRLARDLRRLGARVDVDGRGNSLKSMLRRADSSRAAVCLVLGETEVERGVVQLKNLGQHTQEELPLDAAAAHVAELLRTLSPEAVQGGTGGNA